MCDVFDEIIDRLPPSTIRLISDFKNCHLNLSTSMCDLLQNLQELKSKQVNRDLRSKIFDIKSNTEQNRKYLIRLRKELETLKSLKKSEENESSVKAYTVKINELECKMKSLTGNEIKIDLSQLFNDIEELKLSVDIYKKRVSEAKSKYQCYDNFPPDIQKGKEVIAKIKERIKQNESVVESLFQA